METTQRKWDWKLWLLWVAVSLAAAIGTWAVYFALEFSLIAVPAEAFTVLSWVLYPVPGLIFGAVTGVAQWLVLRRRVQRAGRWFWASLVGWGLGWLGHDFLWIGWRAWMGVPPRFARTSVAYVAAVLVCVAAARAVAGAVAGGSQWLVLRRQVPRAGWWVLASTVAAVLDGFCIAEC